MDLILEGAIKGQYLRILLDKAAFRIGRTQEADIRLDDSTVSRSHALLTIRDDHIELKDLGSHNGTYLNGQKITDSVTVRPGDQIRVGSVVLTLLPVAAPTVGLQQVATILLAPDSVRTVTQIPLEVIREMSKAVLEGENLATVVQSRVLDPRETAAAEPETYEGQLDVITMAIPRMIATQTPDEAIQSLPELVQCMGIPRTLVLLLHDSAQREVYVKAAWPAKALGTRRILLTPDILRTAMNERMSRLVEGDAITTRGPGSDPFQDPDRVAFLAPIRVNDEAIGLLYVGRSDLQDVKARGALHAFNSLASLFAMKMAQCIEFDRRLREHARLQREKDRMADAIAIAARIQKKLLPEHLPEVPGYEIGAALWPSLETAGDLYDVSQLSPDKAGLVVGDASGKGLGAALLMANVLASLRMSFTDTEPLARILERLNAQLEPSTEPDHFVTLFLGRLDVQGHRLEYLNAGHIFPVVLRPGAEPVRLETTGIPAGMMPGVRYGVETIDVPPGTLLCLYTDGIPEAAAANGEEYGEERLHALLARSVERPVAETLAALRSDLDAFLGDTPLADDTTIVLVRRVG